jgi:hypothetical protein
MSADKLAEVTANQEVTTTDSSVRSITANSQEDAEQHEHDGARDLPGGPLPWHAGALEDLR